MQLVRNFSGNFAKSIGKDAGATGCLPGRWCGNFNKRLLPLSPRTEGKTEEKAAVALHRLARKSRQKKKNNGNQRAGQALMEKFLSRNVSQTGLWRLRSGYDLNGHLKVI